MLSLFIKFRGDAQLFISLLSVKRYIILACCYSVAKLCLTLCNPIDCNTLAFPLPHYLPEFVQVHVHKISDPM